MNTRKVIGNTHRIVRDRQTAGCHFRELFVFRDQDRTVRVIVLYEDNSYESDGHQNDRDRQFDCRRHI